ncbi:hypothetical protein [Trichormus variabilis]|uniref:hypothetical protein n=1 Tax=Anabaena variabilis TaxID=264691 RepID=UPI001F5576B1|nr:hypothetical protein [Trichormus variabilis]
MATPLEITSIVMAIIKQKIVINIPIFAARTKPFLKPNLALFQDQIRVSIGFISLFNPKKTPKTGAEIKPIHKPAIKPSINPNP